MDVAEEEKIADIKSEILDFAKVQLGPLFDESEANVLENFETLVIREALDICNMQETSRDLRLIEAMVIQAIIIAYQNRGVEGLAKQTELGQANSYVSWIDYLRVNLIKSGKRFVQ